MTLEVQLLFLNISLRQNNVRKNLITYQALIRIIFIFIKSTGGDCDVMEISTHHYKKFVKIPKERNVSSATIKSYGNSFTIQKIPLFLDFF